MLAKPQLRLIFLSFKKIFLLYFFLCFFNAHSMEFAVAATCTKVIPVVSTKLVPFVATKMIPLIAAKLTSVFAAIATPKIILIGASLGTVAIIANQETQVAMDKQKVDNLVQEQDILPNYILSENQGEFLSEYAQTKTTTVLNIEKKATQVLDKYVYSQDNLSNDLIVFENKKELLSIYLQTKNINYRKTLEQRYRFFIIFPGFNDNVLYKFPGADRYNIPLQLPGPDKNNNFYYFPESNKNNIPLKFPGPDKSNLPCQCPSNNSHNDSYECAYEITSSTNTHDRYNNNQTDSALHYSSTDPSHRKENANHTVSSEFKTMQMNGDKTGLKTKKEQLEEELRNARFWQKNSIRRQIAEIDKFLKSSLTETLSIIKEADLYSARNELNRLESLEKNEDFYDPIFCIKENKNVSSLSDICNAARKVFYARSDLASNLPFYQNKINIQKNELSQKINNTWSPSERVSLYEQIDAIDALETTIAESQNNILHNEHGITNIDNLDMVSTTISQDTLTITPKSNQRITEILNTVDDQNLEALFYQIDFLTITLQEQELSPGVLDKSFVVGVESHALLQKYTENPNKHIVAQPRVNVDIFYARKQALKAVSYDPVDCSEKLYKLNPDTYTALQSYRIDPEQFTYCFGNKVQQQLHSEFVTILNEMAKIPLNSSTQPLLDMVITCTHVGNVYAEQNNIEKAFSLADCAWAALDCARELSSSGIDVAKTRLPEIAQGILEGCINAISNTAHMVINPRETLSNIGSTFAHLGFCLMDVMSSTDDDFLAFNLDNHKTIEENAQKRQEKVVAIVNAVKQTTLKGATSFVTEQIVLGQITGLGIDVIKHYAKPSIAQLAKIGRALNDKVSDKAPKIVSAFRQQVADKLGPKAVAVTSEGVKVPISNVTQKTGLLQRSDKVGESIKGGTRPPLTSNIETHPGSQTIKNAAIIAEEQVVIKSTQSLAELRQSVLSLEKRMLTSDELKRLGLRGDSFTKIDNANPKTGHIRVYTELQGDMKKAEEVLNRVKQEFAPRGLIAGDSKMENGIERIFCKFEDGSHVQIRTEGKSGHLKIDINDVLANTYEKITFK